MPADCTVRHLSLRPLRAWIRPWVLPDSATRPSGLWAPQRHARHPRCWGWLLAATTEDVARCSLQFDAFYYFKRFAEETVDDEAPVNDGRYIIEDSLPVALIRIEMLLASIVPAPEPPPWR